MVGECNSGWTIRALEAGKHVLSEVPAAVDLTQCWELVRAARASRAMYMFSENVNFGREIGVVNYAAGY